MKGFRDVPLELSGVLLIVANSGSSLFVSCGLMASMYGVILGLLAEMGGRCSCYIGVIAELNGCCSCAPGPGQAADLPRSGQCCDLFELQDTHFSAWGLLPVHTIISDGATGIVSPLGRVAAAASSFNFQPDLPAASAAKAFHYMVLLEHQLQTLKAAPLSQAAATLVGSPCMSAIVLHMGSRSGAGLPQANQDFPGLVVFSSGTVVKYAAA